MKIETYKNNCYICDVEKINCDHLLCLDCDKEEEDIWSDFQ